MEKGGDTGEGKIRSPKTVGQEFDSDSGRTKRISWRMVGIWGIILLLITVGFLLGLDKKLIALVVVLFGLLTQAFAGLLGFLGLLPWVGPLLVKVVAGPFLWLLNSLGTLLAFIALRRGYKVDLLKSRILVTTFLLGLLVGTLL
ncbi:hypothetical protein IIA15_04855 [candidate division TA06 bacterium]|nr:hypothetical protein [candidate division TA06 bacterium]